MNNICLANKHIYLPVEVSIESVNLTLSKFDN
jgi:hypothetical protein